MITLSYSFKMDSLRMKILSLFILIFFSACSSSNLNFGSTPSINPNITPPDNIRTLSDVNTIAFEWNLIQNPEIAGYYIYRKKPNEQSFSKIATLDSRFITHYADNKLESNTEYLYQFASFDAQKNISQFSSPISAKTQFIEAINYVEAISNYPRKVKIIWNPHQDTRVIGYVIEKKKPNGQWSELANINSRLLVEYLDIGLEDNTSYEYRVFAYNTNKTYSLPSKSVKATTKPKPTPITNFTATTNIPKQITLKWDLHPNPEITQYNLFRSNFESSFFSKLATLPNNTDTYQDAIKDDGKQYYYKITATDKDGIESLEVGPIMGMTLGIPNTPVITYAQIEGDSAVLRWTPQDDRATEYIVYKKDSRFFGETLRYNKVLTPEFIDREVIPGEKYYYRVSAVDANGLESKQTQEIMLFLPTQ
ncbi:fibronectin type III domain-containing protein [Helicobacter canadensis]|uniref:Fibronectin domain containing protein n=1 Tax=Helicobacter canadensis MIT 98-5491 TaxID=537970 RepID=C5ZWU0_9HELI|nr:fibronectin type III domain-containing protein [Helicobacter canadensis]EES89608.1 fibronectin domain containing protein [Helicobacter canadensis MIT 98-5491]STO99645.1 fibronectin type III domain-containing protein [Helicobacter canadensis]